MIFLTPYLSKAQEFLQISDTSLGVDVQDDRIVVVRARKGARRNKVLRRIEVPIDKEKSLKINLQEIAEKYKLKSTYTVINFPLDKLLYKIIDIPFIPQMEIRNFLLQNTNLFLPDSLPSSDIVIAHMILDETADGLRVLVLTGRRDEVSDFIEQLPDSKLLSLVPGAFGLHFFQKEITNESFSGFIFSHSDRTIDILDYEDGRVQSFERMSIRQFHEKTESILLNKIDDKNLDILVHNAGSETVESPFPLEFSENTLNNGESVEESRYRNAVGLSLMPFTSNDNQTLNLLTEDSRLQIQNDFHKHLTLKLTLASGLLIFFLYFLLFSLNLVLSSRQNNILAERSSLLPYLQKKKDLGRKNLYLNQLLQDFEKLKTEKSYMAFYILQIAKSLPGDAWLSSMSMEENKEQGKEILASGFAKDERNVANFLGKLEELPFKRQVILKKMEKVSQASNKYGRPQANANFIQFEIVIYV